jgi:hypothetical protein
MESLSLVKSAVAEIISTTKDDLLKRLATVLEQLCSVVDEVDSHDPAAKDSGNQTATRDSE